MTRTNLPLMLAILLALLLSTSACLQDQQSPLPLPDPNSIVDKQADADENDRAKDKEKSNEVVLAPGGANIARSSLSSAQHHLERRFDGFLDRKELGLEPALISRLIDDLQTFGASLSSPPDRSKVKPLTFALDLLPFPLLIMFLGLFLLLENQARRLGHSLQAPLHVEYSPFASDLLRSLLLLGANITPVIIILLLSYFPLHALFEAPWTTFLSHALWALLSYRAITLTLHITLGLRIIRVSEEHAAKLSLFAFRYGRLILLLTFLELLVDDLGFHKSYIAAADFILSLGIATFPLFAAFRRDALLDLLPDDRGARWYLVFRDTLVKNFYALCFLSLILMTLRAFGYVKASTFIITRSYALILTVVVGFGLLNRMRDFFERRIDAFDPRDIQVELLTTIYRLLYILLLFSAASLLLKALALYDAVLILLKIPLFAIYRVEFSIYNALSAVLIITSSLLIAKVLKFLLNAKVYPAFRIDVGVAYAINTLLNYLIVVVGFFLVLVALGVNLSALTVVLASLSVGIGFGLQTIIENLISGFILLFGRSVRKGDYITVKNTYGRVEAVGARSVVLRTIDNYDVLIPSKELVNDHIINWTFKDTIVRLRIDVGVTYACDPRQVEEILLQVAEGFELALNDPPPEVWLTSFGDSSVNFQLLLYYDCRRSTPDNLKGRLYFEIWDTLAEHDIEIPFPQRDLHLRSTDLMPQIKKLLDSQKP